MRNTARKPTSGPTKAQIKMIHTLVSALGYDEPQYRVVLYHNFKVMSSKQLTPGQAKDLIDGLQETAIRGGVWTKKTAYDNLSNRIGMATPLQLRKIETLWRELTDIKDESARKKALRSFLFNRFHVSDLRFIGTEQVTGIMTALRHMNARKETKRENASETPLGWQESL